MGIGMAAVGSSEYFGRWDTVIHCSIPIVDPLAEVAVVCVVIFGTTTAVCPLPVFCTIIMNTFHTSKNLVSWTIIK